MLLHVDSSLLDSVCLDDLSRFILFNKAYYGFFLSNYGKEHYKLLALMSSQLPYKSLVVDLGTLYGSSALALSYNESVDVFTYDITDFVPTEYLHTVNRIGNITRFIKDGISDVENYLNASVILLDVDPHDGVQELELYHSLTDLGYKGIVVCDDIHLNDKMEMFWKSVKHKKIDATKYGHYSGTGIIVFCPEYIDVTVD